MSSAFAAYDTLGMGATFSGSFTHARNVQSRQVPFTGQGRTASSASGTPSASSRPATATSEPVETEQEKKERLERLRQIRLKHFG
jgi:hypothetical protein